MNVRQPAEVDASAVTALVRAFEERLAGKPEQSEGDLRDDWAELDLAHDAWLVEIDGALAGYGALYTNQGTFADGYVHPAFWGRGVGTRLVELGEAEARRRGAPALQIPVLGNDDGAHTLLERRGYRPVRRYYRMEIELDAEPPDPRWPDELRVLPYADAQADAFHAALDEAFAEEWGHEPERGVDWRAVRERRSPDRSVWFAVEEGEEIAAAVVAEEERWGVGWIHAIGVRPAWRRRGLGEALLLHCFGELYRRGRPRVGLGVDAENPTGATRLYERAGMHVASSFVYFEKELGG
jgi:mycothiol synthase